MNLAIIGASYLQRPLIEKAIELGYTVHVFAWKDGADILGLDICFYDISITNKVEILKICKELDVVGVVSIASDLANITVNYIANSLSLPTNSEECLLVTTNKTLMRKNLLKKGIRCPHFLTGTGLYEIEAILNLKFPVIVKPEDRSGSRGIFKVEKFDELPNAIANAKEESFSKQVLVEEFIAGKEFSVEFISQNGIHYPLAITEKITSGAPNFVEIGHVQHASINKELEQLVYEFVNDVLIASGVQNGASHTEIIITKEKTIYLVEVASRMGGDFIGSHMVFYSTGYDFIKSVIDCSVGNPIEIPAQVSITNEVLIAFDGFKEFKQVNINEFSLINDILFGEKIEIENTTTQNFNSAKRYCISVYKKNNKRKILILLGLVYKDFDLFIKKLVEQDYDISIINFFKSGDNFYNYGHSNITYIESSSITTNKNYDFILSIGWRKILKGDFFVYHQDSLILNFHPAILPEYKGYHTEPYVLFNQERKHGLTIHILNEGLDSGEILFQTTFDLNSFDTIVSIKDKLNKYCIPKAWEFLLAFFNNPTNFKTSENDDAYTKVIAPRRVLEDSILDINSTFKSLIPMLKALQNSPYLPFYYDESGCRVQVKLISERKEKQFGEI